MARLASVRGRVGFSESLVAQAKAVGRTSSGLHNWLTRPRCRARWALMGSPKKISSFAAEEPMSLGRRHCQPVEATLSRSSRSNTSRGV
jgi:hypothetical protein